MRIVGLTGGIASGKSSVSDLFKAHGIPVVDADLIARDMPEKGTPGWKKVVEAFGDDILLGNGEIDRKKLGELINADPGKKKLLNEILASRIYRGIFREILKLWMKCSKVIVLDDSMLFEAELDKWTKPKIVVWVDPETQLRRLVSSEGLSEDDAWKKINAEEMSLDRKRDLADIVIDNTGSSDELNGQFLEVLSQVTRPLTWPEFLCTREGALLILVSVIVVVIACRNFYTKNGV